MMHVAEYHFKQPVRVGVRTGNAADTDKWWQRQARLELGDTCQRGRTGNLFGSCNTDNLYVVDEHQGYTAPHH